MLATSVAAGSAVPVAASMPNRADSTNRSVEQAEQARAMASHVLACRAMACQPMPTPYLKRGSVTAHHMPRYEGGGRGRRRMAHGIERKLTTILAADVEGYSSLMEADEAGAMVE